MRGVARRRAGATESDVGLAIALRCGAAGALGAGPYLIPAMRFSRLILLVTAFLVTACSDAPTGGEQTSLADLQQLAQVEAAERQRVALAAAESQAVFNSLHAQFLLGGIVTGLVNTVDYTLSAVIGLLVCEPEPYLSTVKTIGPDGGTIRVGSHWLVIPRNALRKKTVITAERPSDDVASVRFSPHGLKFARSAVLTLDYSHCSYSAPNRVAYTDEMLNILEYPISFDDRRNEQVVSEIDHFSRYAVAY